MDSTSNQRRVQPVTSSQHLAARYAPPAAAPSISLGDIYYTLFRHKGKILICGTLGLLAAALLFKFFPPPFCSESRVYIRYILDSSNTDPIAGTSKMKSPDERGETIINTEVMILSSLDLAKEVASSIGAEKLLGGKPSPDPLSTAATSITKGLTVEAPKNSSVVLLSFQHSDPTLVQPVLNTLISEYLKKHKSVHQAGGIVGEFLSQETDQLRSRLAQTEEELRQARARAGVVSIEDSKRALTEQISKIRDEILSDEADLALKVTTLSELTAPTSTPQTPNQAEVTPAPPSIPQELIESYHNVLSREEKLRARERELLLDYTPEGSLVTDVRRQLAEVLQQRKDLEASTPALLNIGKSMTLAESIKTNTLNIPAEKAAIKALEAKITVRRAQLEAARAEVTNINQLEGSIHELTRKQELEEKNYRSFAASLERSRIEEALGTGRVSNISIIQSPTPPFIDRKKSNKIVIGVGLGGFVLGLAWAFAFEMFIDTSIRRPIDIERSLGARLFISIPKVNRQMRKKLALSLGTDGKKMLTPPKEPANSSTPALQHTAPVTLETLALQPFHETLRDRLVGYFESINLTHKPKLIAVTGLNTGVGVTTTAAGLAKSLSGSGNSNVLLVDMTGSHGAAQQFYQGQAVTNIDQMLDKRDSALVHENLYVVAESRNSEQLSRNLPQRFNKLIPELKASNFDYIIFDMPPVNQISITPRLAGFMDMVLFVIESEKNATNVVRRATALLAESKAQIGTILNKTTAYVPTSLHQDTFDDL